jgi:hypothetical protein
MNDLGPDAHAIIDAARHLDDPSEEQCERVKRSLLAAAAAAGAAPLVAPSTAAASTLKIVLPIAFALAGGVIAGVWWYARHGSAPARAPSAQHVSVPSLDPGASVAIETAPPEVDHSKVADVPRARRTTASSDARPPLAPPHNRLEEETRLLGQASEALRAGDPLAAQALLDEYDRRFPAGVLREEMQATRAIARCVATPGPFAQEAARQFLMQHPASPLAARVAGSCNLPSR